MQPHSTAASTAGCTPPQPRFLTAADKRLTKFSGASRPGYQPQPPLTFPADFHSLPEFVTRHVQVTLRLLDGSVSQHELDDTDVHAIGKQSARAFMSQVEPAQVDFAEPVAVP